MPDPKLPPLPPEQIGKFTKQTRVLISFGAAKGGFEFALQLRQDIYRWHRKSAIDEPAYVYIDAISLAGHELTTYDQIKGADIYKMANPYWDTFYPAAMERCTTMIFLLTFGWLASANCWEELGWFRERLAKNSVIRPIFVVFPDAVDALKKPEITTVQKKVFRPRETWEEIRRIPRAVVVEIQTEIDSSLEKVEVIKNFKRPGQYRMSDLEFVYACNEIELQAILNRIV